MTNLIESLTFMVSTFGALNIFVMCVGSGILVSKFVSSCFDDDRKEKKQLIKDTIKEYNDVKEK